MARTFWNSLRVLAVAGLTLAAGLVFAQSAPLPVPMSITPVGPTPAGLQSVVTFDARNIGGAANAGYYSRPVLISNNTLGGLARGMLGRALPVAAMIAAVEGAGWVIDELTGQVMSGPTPNQTIPQGSSYVESSLGYHSSMADAGNARAAWHNSLFNQGAVFAGLINCTVPSATGAYSCHVLLQRPGRNDISYGATYHPGAESPLPRHVWEPVPSPVPDPDLGALVRDNPNLWNDALRNPDGSVNRNPDVMNEAERLRDALHNPDPTTNPAPDPTAEWDTGYQEGDPQPNGQGQTALDFPNFCSWATTVCELADWLREDETEVEPDAEMPIMEPDTAVSWDSGFSGGSCPAPIAISVLDTEVEFSHQPLCDLAAYIRPIVLAAAALLGVFIIGGFRRAS